MSHESLHIAQHSSIADLVRNRPTPLFVMSRSRLRQNYCEFRRCFPGATVCYAMKANSENEVLTTLAREGSSFEAASLGELQLLQNLGVPPGRIIYGSAIKPGDHIRNFAAYGVDHFSADSFHELEKLAAAASGARVFIRAKVDDTDSHFAFSEKFGADFIDVVPLILRARELDLRPVGISFHVGSQCSNPRSWGNAIQALSPTLSDLATHGWRMESLNIGGGFPCPDTTEESASLAVIATHTLAACARLSGGPQLILEPGRGMVATSAVLVTRVIARVRRGTCTWLFLDAGVYNALFEALACQGSIRFPVSSISNAGDGPTALFSLAGPTGDGLDVVARSVSLPQETREGDLLCIHHTGAYSLACASAFNGFAKPDVIFADWDTNAPDTVDLPDSSSILKC